MGKVHINFPPVSLEEKKKRRGRPFERGNTMGKGRPKGSLNKMTERVKEIWSQYAYEIAENTAIMAQAGDQVGLQIYWGRVFPVRAGAPVEFEMPVVRYADDVAPAYNAVLQARRKRRLDACGGHPGLSDSGSSGKGGGRSIWPALAARTKALIERIQQMRETREGDAQAAEDGQQEVA
jgi:hypothetical protein